MALLSAAAPHMPMLLAGAAKQMRDKPKPAPAIPMPDVEEIERKKRGARRTGRASTILTGTDGLGG